MLAYDHDCPNCGIREVLQRHQEHDICPDCSAKVRVILSPVPTHGIVFSNAEHNSQIGVTWETNAQKRAWHKAHPNAVPVEKGSQADKNFSQSLKEKQHAAVDKAGYNNIGDFKTALSKKVADDKNAAR